MKVMFVFVYGGGTNGRNCIYLRRKRSRMLETVPDVMEGGHSAMMGDRDVPLVDCFWLMEEGR